MTKIFILINLIFLTLYCESKYDWTNPLDSNNNLSPEDWAPKNLHLERFNESQVRLTWQQEEDRIKGFRIERKIDDGQWQRLVQLEASERNYTDTGLEITKEYSYKVCAFVKELQSGFSNEESIRINEIGTVTDIDGNVYQTVKIGNQWWMAENLKVTYYRNGDPILPVVQDAIWLNLAEGAYCDYDNNPSNFGTYGLLYNWFAVDVSRNIAPEGWHVPTDDEWKELEMYLGMSQTEVDQLQERGTDEGGKLKEVGFDHWESPNEGANNEYGFSALPGGYRSSNSTFYDINNQAIFWSTTEGHDATYAWIRYLSYNSSGIGRGGISKQVGSSVRCIRD